MIRSVMAASAVLLLASAGTAQCFVTNFGTLCPNSAGAPGMGDDLLFDLLPMNITFPMGGVAATYTHAHISSNGVIYLTNGAASAGSTTGYPTQALFAGAAGQPPRIAAMWTDLEHVPANNGGVFYNDTIPGRFVVTWSNAQEWATTTPIFTVQAQLFANGNVVFTYSGVAQTTAADSTTGLSQGNGIAPVPDVDLSAGGNVSATRYIAETMTAGTFDLANETLTFTPSGGGYSQAVGPCNSAFHEAYGTGCYNLSDSFYQFFDDSTAAPAALNGNSLTLLPLGASYFVTWGPGTYVPPSINALIIPLGDDAETAQTPSIPLPTPQGPVSPLYVHSNGMISHGPNNGIQPISYTPDVNGFLNAPATGFFSWHDYNPSEPGSGPIKYEELVVGSDTIAYVTWEGVESYASPETANPSTLQFQLNLTNGTVTIVWVTIDGNPSSVYGSAHLVGWGVVGPSANGGNLNLATATPMVTSTTNMAAISLAASPNPVSTAISGTVVTYTTTNIPEILPASGVYISTNILSVGGIPGGLDLGFIGAPGCSAYIASLDYLQAMVGGPTNSVTLPIPAGIPSGTILYSQSVGLVTPGSLPNGQNAFGMTVSNGVRSYIAPF